ncbi:hypothetical protein L0657_04660 [Dyadobacter sp. CY345]|uniref:hypothetical protein n=1 Tax=Dyadobacter sp. CY345 TaxID=2909335 RepID=UPI001F226B2E|nr:hypothetical protein [Dyadobacter sp. CY345]MCF2443238.1 hypothetical protein [Dyadobacter sp. CY345]
MNENPAETQSETIEIHPADKELNVVVKTEISGLLKNEEPKYLLKIVNLVPIIVFLFQDPKDSFFKEINYPVILERADTDWIDQPVITINIIKVSPVSSNVDPLEKMMLSPSDSELLRQSCRNQVGKTAEFIESSITHIYDSDHHEWFYQYRS